MNTQGRKTFVYGFPACPLLKRKSSVCLCSSKSVCFHVRAVSVVVYLVFDVLLACGTLKEGESLGWLVVALAAVYTIFALLQFIAAAKGIKGCGRKEAAEDLKKWGVILLIVSIIAGLFNCYASVSQGASVVSGVISAVFSLVLPVLYLYGASLNEKA